MELDEKHYALVDLMFQVRMCVRRINSYPSRTPNFISFDLVETWFDILFQTPTAFDLEELLKWIDMFDRHNKCLNDFASALENLKIAENSLNELTIANCQKITHQYYKLVESSFFSCRNQIIQILEDSNARQKSRATTPEFSFGL